MFPSFIKYNIPVTRPNNYGSPIHKLPRLRAPYSLGWSCWYTTVVILLCKKLTTKQLSLVLQSIPTRCINDANLIANYIKTAYPQFYRPNNGIHFSEL